LHDEMQNQEGLFCMNETMNPEELSKEGQAAYQLNDYQSAAQAFRAAAQGYRARGDEVMWAESMNNCSVAYLQADEAKLALEVLKNTANVFEGAGDVRRQGLAVGNEGSAMEAMGRLEEASNAYKRSADLLDLANEPELRAHVLQRLSALQLRMGRQMESLATMQSGLNGVRHPSLFQRLLRNFLQLPFRLLNRR
jgi:tetratricopeptide (TPR) repeat protein